MVSRTAALGYDSASLFALLHVWHLLKEGNFGLIWTSLYAKLLCYHVTTERALLPISLGCNPTLWICRTVCRTAFTYSSHLAFSHMPFLCWLCCSSCWMNILSSQSVLQAEVILYVTLGQWFPVSCGSLGNLGELWNPCKNKNHHLIQCLEL